MRAGSALLISNETIAAIGEKRPSILRTMLDLRAHRADKTLRLVSDLSLRTVPARLASFLCTLAAARELRGEDARGPFSGGVRAHAGKAGGTAEQRRQGLAGAPIVFEHHHAGG